ncbi:MAG: hypothetical protein JO181_03365 [Solirubrobacterales bacterium]|nr:hypothetical protein [Solirubrobacterales bacterium]
MPVVAVPFGRDQLETARRVEVARAGVRLPRRRLNGARLAHAVRAAIDQRDGAATVSRAYQTAGRARAAADVLHALARAPASTTRAPASTRPLGSSPPDLRPT